MEEALPAGTRDHHGPVMASPQIKSYGLQVMKPYDLVVNK